MTISDLIELLQEKPQNAQILTSRNGGMMNAAPYVLNIHAIRGNGGWYQQTTDERAENCVYIY